VRGSVRDLAPQLSSKRSSLAHTKHSSSMLHQRSESSPNFSASALGQAFHNLSLDQPQSPMLPSSNARRRLTKRQPSAVVLAKIDGRVLGSEADDPSAKTPHDGKPLT
jgi:hypothetical protein